MAMLKVVTRFVSGYFLHLVGVFSEMYSCIFYLRPIRWLLVWGLVWFLSSFLVRRFSRFFEAYSQTAWRPVKPLVRAHLRKAVNKAQ